MRKGKKHSGSISIIGGSDGPTSIFLVGRHKKTIRQKVHKRLFDMRKKWCSLWIKPRAHTMKELVDYIKEKYGFEEIQKDTREYLTQYDSLRTSFIMQYKPELLGKYAAHPELEGHDEESLKEFMQQLEIREQKAKEIPDDQFKIDFYVLKKTEGQNMMHFYLESGFDYIGGGFSGENGKRKYEKIYKDAYRYYGVTEEDIVNKTKRYHALLTTLAMKGQNLWGKSDLVRCGETADDLNTASDKNSR